MSYRALSVEAHVKPHHLSQQYGWGVLNNIYITGLPRQSLPHISAACDAMQGASWRAAASGRVVRSQGHPPEASLAAPTASSGVSSGSRPSFDMVVRLRFVGVYVHRSPR